MLIKNQYFIFIILIVDDIDSIFVSDSEYTHRPIQIEGVTILHPNNEFMHFCRGSAVKGHVTNLNVDLFPRLMTSVHLYRSLLQIYRVAFHVTFRAV